MKLAALSPLHVLVFANALLAGPLKAGVATKEITPPLGGPLWGYASRHDKPSVGVRDPLLARAVVIDDGVERVVIFSLDLGRPPSRAVSRIIREKLITLKFNHMLMVASHTHHGPVLELDNWPDANNPYNRYLGNALCELAVNAAENCQLARFGAASKSCELNKNRQSKKVDAPVDREIVVLQLDDLKGKPIASLVNFAAHPTMLPASLCEFSADFPGALCKRVEQRTGAPCLFLQGCSGDLSTKSPPGVSGPDGFGDALANEVIAIRNQIKCETSQISLRGVREDFCFPCAIKVEDQLIKAALGRVFFPALVDFYDAEYRDGVRPEINVVMLDDDAGIVGFSGEVFCGHALTLRKKAGVKSLLVCGCCNDYQQYFPTKDAIDEGGYGTSPPVAMAEPGAGERMTERALHHLGQLRKRR